MDRLGPIKKVDYNAVAAAAVEPGRAHQHACELARALRIVHAMEPRVVVEIGSYTGWSLWAWTRVIDPGALVISIDLPHRKLDKLASSFDKNPEMLKYFNDFDMHFIRRDSTDPETKEELIKILGKRTIDFLFIDGGHSYETVRSDHDMYTPLVNGVVGFHDIAQNHRNCRVIDLWNEIKNDYVSKEFVLKTRRRARAGIGMIFNKASRK